MMVVGEGGERRPPLFAEEKEGAVKVRVLNSWLGVPGSIVEMPDAEAMERIAAGEVEPVKTGSRERRKAALDVPEER